jgi:glucokinase
MAATYLCGVDLGGTKMSAGIFTPDGTPVASRKVTDHAGADNDGMTDRVAEIVQDLLAETGIRDDQLRAIGVGMAAHTNSYKGIIITSSNFAVPFRNYPMGERLSKRFSAPIIVDNDANAQAYGEFRFGAGRGKEDMVFLTVSTGVGAGIISGGRLLRGRTGIAGEIGHTIVDPNSDIRCTCGNYGCLMALSSGLGLTERYARHQRAGLESTLGVHPGDTVDGHLLRKGYETGDPISTTLVEESADFIGIGVYNIFQVLNPEAVVLGGGLMHLGPKYLARIRAKFLSLVQNMMYEEMEVLPAQLGGDAGLVGAAALGLEER